MVQNGYCPRGPFCAFAHVERKLIIRIYFDCLYCVLAIHNWRLVVFSFCKDTVTFVHLYFILLCFADEITAQRDLLSTYENNLAAYMSNALEGDNGRKKSIDENMHGDEDKTSNNGSITVENSNKLPSGTTGTNGSMAGKSAPLGVLLLSVSEKLDIVCIN